MDGLFNGCRSLIGVDGCHLKGNYGEVLLSAIALDGNDELFPFAWAIVSSENEESWMFFLHQLKNLLQPGGRDNQWCIISDRRCGIDNALSRLWPEVACGAYSAFTFKKAMEAINKTNPAARLWLANLGEQCRWTKHKFDPTIKCDVNKTNFVESFNATLGIDRCRPVLTLLEGIRRVTMVRLATRREACEKWQRNDICPNIMRRVQVLCQESRTCLAMLSEKGEYEIQDGKSRLPVSLIKRTCICGQWQLIGIPCRHGMRAILHPGLEPVQFVDNWYSVQKYKDAYGHGIKPISDIEQWPELDLPVIQPPTMKRGVGRPCRNRRRESGHNKNKESGHNKNTCKGGLTAKQKKSKAKSKADETLTSKAKKGQKKDKASLSQLLTSKTAKEVNNKRVASSQPSTSKPSKKQKK
ncbi:Msx2-interacting protein [Bienertia sinuspersici]